jgi:hypothetical protein
MSKAFLFCSQLGQRSDAGSGVSRFVSWGRVALQFLQQFAATCRARGAGGENNTRAVMGFTRNWAEVYMEVTRKSRACCLLGCDAEWFGRSLPMLPRNGLPPSSASNSNGSKQVE